MDEVTICNMALARIGISQQIASITGAVNDDRARACKLFYENCRNQTLRDFAWNFAAKCLPLAAVGTPPPGWGSQFRYPSDAERILVISDAGGMRWPVIANWDWGFLPWPYMSSQLPSYPYQVMADPDGVGRVIVTDCEAPYCWYTKRVADPNQFDSQFVSALAWNLAGEIALPLKTNPTMSQNALKMYTGMKSIAEASSLSEALEDINPASPSISGRL